MPRRAGSGRKPGSKNIKTRAIADQAAANGITPLEVMIKAMRHFDAEGNLAEASRIAKDAAPYMHPRLASVEHATKDGKPLADNSVVVYGGVLIKADEAMALVKNTQTLVAEPVLPELIESSECSGSG